MAGGGAGDEVTVMGMQLRTVVACVCGLLLAACAGTAPRDRMAERLEEYRAVAGEPVPHFRYFQLWSWEPLGHEAVAIYTRPGEAWLLDLTGPCLDLPYTPVIAVSSSLQRVYARFDNVYTGRRQIPCRIETIRPVDVKKLRAAAKERREVEQIERGGET